MKTEEQVLTMELRQTLKATMKKELEKLPDTLQALEPKDRLNVLCRLMPFVFPKVETIHAKEDEPIQFDSW